VADYKAKGKRLPGYGHKIYEVDPRTQILLKIAESTSFSGKFVKLALEIERELANSSGKKLPLNIDGITAALMCELGFSANLGKSLFIVSRVAGIAAHVAEEQDMKTLRRLDEDEIDYSGTPKRPI
jgi:citrate synthase